MYACIRGAADALSGELHGGANIQVMKMLFEIGDIDKVDSWVEDQLRSGRIIMGMGSAIYDTTDPRADVLSRLSKLMSQVKGTKWFEITESVEKAVQRYMVKNQKKQVYPVADLYSASLYYNMNIPMDLWTLILAMSRVSGWCAHVIEEKFAEACSKS